MINVAELSIDHIVILTGVIMLIAIVALVNPFAIGITNFLKRCKKIDSPVNTFESKLVFFTICLTISMWSLQFLSELYGAFVLATGENNVSEKIFVWEIFASSFAGTLKSFGADDNFLSGMENIKMLLRTVFTANDRVISVYSVVASVMAFCAPITSATIFFEILSNFFPKVKFWFLRYCILRKKYYFSELNERSLALAKSITQSAKFIRPAIIFTDVYANKTQEKTTELLTETKRIGAVCLRDDITHLQKRGLGGRKFFLIDDNEVNNLQTLTNLTDKINHKFIKDSEIYLFCQDFIYADIEKQVRQKMSKEYGYGEDDFTIIPVRCYRNLITNMLEKTPLYEPIIQKRKENPDAELDLNVTILGIGDIGREMFLTTYWMGQMLDCKLNINVISKESEEEFWGKIDYINPEIRHTLKKGDEILGVYYKRDEHDNLVVDKSRLADPYAEVNYISCNVESESFMELLQGNPKSVKGNGIDPILDAHYILVSLGSDQANLSVANILKKYIGKYHIEHKDRADKTIINYVVYNADLSSTLNSNPFVCSYSKRPDIYMQAVGGVEQIYTANNIFMIDYYDSAEAGASDYGSKQIEANRINDNKNRLDDEYKYWANMALRLHFKYKVFSVIPFSKSLFDNKDEYNADVVYCCKKYKALVHKCDDLEQAKKHHELAWLEHRRWNAFLRTMGYCQTNDYAKYFSLTKSHKQSDLKLHPCLVECNKNGVQGIVKKDGTVESHIFNADDTKIENFDLLDKLSFDLYQLTHEFSDFKEYDYPNNKYLDEIPLETNENTEE